MQGRGTPLTSLSPRLKVFRGSSGWAPRRASLSQTPRATPDPAASRTLTIRPHGEVRQTEQEQRRRPERGAGAGSLGGHGLGVHGRAGSGLTALGAASDRRCLRSGLPGPPPGERHSAPRCALLASQASRPARGEGGARTAREAGDAAGASGLGPRAPGGPVRGAGEAAVAGSASVLGTWRPRCQKGLRRTASSQGAAGAEGAGGRRERSRPTGGTLDGRVTQSQRPSSSRGPLGKGCLAPSSGPLPADFPAGVL